MPSFDRFAEGVVPGSLGPVGARDAEERAPELGTAAAGVARGEDGDAAGAAAVTHTSAIVLGGGFGWVAPESPEPHTHPSLAPSPTRADAAPVEDHVQPPCPSPCQYPQYCG
jgi:hypothetical protein